MQKTNWTILTAFMNCFVHLIIMTQSLSVEEIVESSLQKKELVMRHVVKKNEYLQAHPESQVDRVVNANDTKIKQLKVKKYLKVEPEGWS